MQVKDTTPFRVCVVHFNFPQKIVQMVEERNTYRIPLCEKAIDLSKVEEYEKHHWYVPDYDAEIIIYSPKEVIRGSKLEFSVLIKDTGIVKMENPYYYIVLIDPDNEVRAIFPHFYGQYSTEPDCKDYPSSYSYSRYWTPWKYSDYSKEVFYVPSDKGKISVKREHLIRSKEFNLLFTYSVDKEGEWKIKVLLFDQNYKTRQGFTLQDRAIENNGIKIETAIVDVVHSIPVTVNKLWEWTKIIVPIFGLFFTIVPSVYYILKKFGNKIEKNLRENM